MRGLAQRRVFAGICLLLFWQSGCAAFRPVPGVPARYLPTEMKVGDRSNRRTIDLSLLRQSPPLDPVTGNVVHRIDAGDVLGVYVEGFVGKPTDPPPVYFPTNNDAPPSFGLPHPVREDGTISLPFVGSVNLRGMTLGQAEERVRQAYLSPKELIRPDHHRVQVNLQRPRQYRVLVIRQDSRNEPQSNAFLGQLNIGVVKRGTGKVVNLPAYSNDVLNALTATDGLPGLDAENAVYVIRRRGNSMGGALDPRWPTDLDPMQLIRSSTKIDEPIIRGQSMDRDSGYLHTPYALNGRYAAPPQNRSAGQGSPWQQGSAGQGSPGQGMDQFANSNPNFEQQQPLEPPSVWPDRASVTPIAFDPSAASAAAGMSAPNPAAAQYGPQPGAGYYGQPYAGGWGGSPTPLSANPGYGPADYPATNATATPPAPGLSAYPVPPHSAPPTGSYGTPQPYGPPAGGYPAQPNSAMPGGAFPDGTMPGGPAMNGPMANSPVTNGPMINGPVMGGPAPGSPVPNGPLPNGAPPGSQPWGPDPGPATMPFPTGPAGDLDPGHGIGGGGFLDGRHVVRIPIRLGPGETADIRPEDVMLNDGDIVFIESRDTEVFYTGGLLGGGQYTLPRDYDLDILQALSLAQSRGVMGSSRSVGGISALNNDVSISPSTAIVLRKLPDGGEIPVRVDLYRARTDLAERIVIQPGDYILLQYTPLEAIGAFFERHLLETAIFGLAAQQFNRTGN